MFVYHHGYAPMQSLKELGLQPPQHPANYATFRPIGWPPEKMHARFFFRNGFCLQIPSLEVCGFLFWRCKLGEVKLQTNSSKRWQTSFCLELLGFLVGFFPLNCHNHIVYFYCLEKKGRRYTCFSSYLLIYFNTSSTKGNLKKNHGSFWNPEIILSTYRQAAFLG